MTSRYFDFLNKYQTRLNEIEPMRYQGKIKRIESGLLYAKGPKSVIGELCQFYGQDQREYWGEVVLVDEEKVMVMPYQESERVELGSDIVAMGEPLVVPVGNALLGRVLNGLGEPIDGLGGIAASAHYSADRIPPQALDRRLIRDKITTGIKAIDTFIPLGRGQRVGIFAGSGVGKSTLLGMIARNSDSDVNVIALIGERGREVREFIENDLGPEGLKRSVLVVATSDMPPLARLKASQTASSIAEYFRDQGKDVMLLFDSITRLAMAQREIGLSLGEPPANRGYTPSVFSLLPKIMERSGTGKTGSITGLYTVLVEGDDLDEPISDAVRGILDGHIVLSRDLANRAHFPAIDVLGSISRLEKAILTDEESELLATLRRYMAVYKEKEDLINIGAYERGTNAELDKAIELNEVLTPFLKQRVKESFDIETSLSELIELAHRVLISDDEGAH